jgi:hypothetical protein
MEIQSILYKNFNMIEEIKFSDSLTIWKARYEFKDKEQCILECNLHIHKYLENINHKLTDGYTYFILNEYKNLFYEKFIFKNELDNIVLSGINTIIDLYQKTYDNDYNKIYTDNWINVVKINPIQKIWTKENDLIFHQHTDLNNKMGRIEPDFTYITYIQMPNNLSNNDGVLYMKDLEGNVFNYLPEEGDIIIMKGEVEHVPNHALKSTVDRIVMAGNVTLTNEKTIKTLL